MKTIQLLKQVRSAASFVHEGTENTAHKALLRYADFIFNELMQQTAPEFYLEFIRDGKDLLDEGLRLAWDRGHVLRVGPAFREHLGSDSSYAAIEREIDKVLVNLSAVVDVLDESRSPFDKCYLERMCAWENRFYSHRLETQAEVKDQQPSGFGAAQFENYLREQFPEWKGLTLRRFTPLDGGFSKKTTLVEIEDRVNGRQSMVIRAEQSVRLCFYMGGEVVKEFAMIQLMRKAGLPVAEPLWLESDADRLGVRFLISRKLDGRIYGDSLKSQEPLNTQQVHSIIQNLIALHRVPVDRQCPLVLSSQLSEWLPATSVREATRYFVQRYMPAYARDTDIGMSPQLLRALKWLDNNVPECDEDAAIVHMDFCLNNLLMDESGVTGILDWETARLGDPAEDIIATQSNLNDHISLSEFLKVYQSGTGREISAYRIAYSKVSRCAMNAITCLAALRAVDKYDAAHISLGVVGLRYMAFLGTQFNSLIGQAEQCRAEFGR